jgi:hypothetical protein
MQSNSDVAGDSHSSKTTADGNSAVRALARDHYFAKNMRNQSHHHGRSTKDFVDFLALLLCNENLKV